LAGTEKRKDPALARLERLAQSIDRLSEKDDEYLRHARGIAEMRHSAAAALYGICSDFVATVNGLLTHGIIVLDPPAYSDDAFREHAANLIQMNVRGRILQVEFEVTPELVSTEDFRVPYTLRGEVRAFNQQLLDKDLIEEQLIFFTLEKPRAIWRYFDARTYRSGPFDREYLVGLMEQLI
jgi:hypothetical protein